MGRCSRCYESFDEIVMIVFVFDSQYVVYPIRHVDLNKGRLSMSISIRYRKDNQYNPSQQVQHRRMSCDHKESKANPPSTDVADQGSR